MQVPGGPGSPAPPQPPEPPERPQWVCWVILVGSVAWWVAQRGLEFSRGEAAPSFALLGPLVQGGEWWRVLTTVFEHSPMPLHILFNMSAVWTLGRVLEYGIGPWRMLITSLVGALGSAVFVLLFNFNDPTVGASGVILAWGGAILPIATQHGRRSIGMWLAQVALISLLPGISWAGHLGGFLFGLACGWAIRGGPERFNTAAPVLLFVSAVLVFLVGSGIVSLNLMGL